MSESICLTIQVIQKCRRYVVPQERFALASSWQWHCWPFRNKLKIFIMNNEHKKFNLQNPEDSNMEHRCGRSELTTHRSWIFHWRQCDTSYVHHTATGVSVTTIICLALSLDRYQGTCLLPGPGVSSWSLWYLVVLFAIERNVSTRYQYQYRDWYR